jgi:hypothetical protein
MASCEAIHIPSPWRVIHVAAGAAAGMLAALRPSIAMQQHSMLVYRLLPGPVAPQRQHLSGLLQCVLAEDGAACAGLDHC